MEENNIFALDIGTRTIIGLIAEKKEDTLIIKDVSISEHKKRAMFDGQIHDIDLVSKTVKEVIESFDKYEIKEAAVAIAGRSLITMESDSFIDFGQVKEITQNDIIALEMDAVNKAYEKLGSTEKSHFCVGYSTKFYKIEGEETKTPLGHKASNIGCEILATFLPRVVVDSMISVLNKVNIQPLSITLEPIAAISVAIPEDLRRLNLLLVDVGAGTSDIAVTKAGSVIGYGAVPMAGDEITEAITDKFLVDFNTAESIKRSLDKHDIFEVNDILDMPVTLTKNDIEEAIKPTIETICKKIADKVIEMNTDVPVAVLLAGGGAQISLFPKILAQTLSLPENRVAIKRTKDLRSIEDLTGLIVGSEFVTPLGIAKTAGTGVFTTIKVNGKYYQMVGLKDLKVKDALMMAKIDHKKLLGKPGKGIVFEVNGDIEIARGEPGKDANILVNGKEVDFDFELKNGDEIEITKPTQGKDAKVYIKDYISHYVKKIMINGNSYDIYPKIYVNKKLVSIKKEINDGDKITIKSVVTVADILDTINENIKTEDEPFYISVNGTTKYLPANGFKIYRNGEEIDYTDVVFDGDNISIRPSMKAIRVKDIVDTSHRKTIKVNLNSKAVFLQSSEPEIFVNGKRSNMETVLKNKDDISIKSSGTILVIDALNALSYDLETLKGKEYEIFVNDKKVGFSHQLKDGDVVQIKIK
jgi:cell division protein FtsA